MRCCKIARFLLFAGSLDAISPRMKTGGITAACSHVLNSAQSRLWRLCRWCAFRRSRSRSVFYRWGRGIFCRRRRSVFCGWCAFSGGRCRSSATCCFAGVATVCTRLAARTSRNSADLAARAAAAAGAGHFSFTGSCLWAGDLNCLPAGSAFETAPSFGFSCRSHHQHSADGEQSKMSHFKLSSLLNERQNQGFLTPVSEPRCDTDTRTDRRFTDLPATYPE